MATTAVNRLMLPIRRMICSRFPIAFLHVRTPSYISCTIGDFKMNSPLLSIPYTINQRFSIMNSGVVEPPKIVNALALILNEGIEATEVRLIHGDINEIITKDNALKIAKSENLDLVVVAPQADPVVCKIMDYSREQYIKKVQSKEAKKKQKAVTMGQTKDIKMKSSIAEHDLKVKCKKISNALKRMHPVRILMSTKMKSLKETPTLIKDMTAKVTAILEENEVPFTIQSQELKSTTALQMMVLPVRPTK